MPTTEHKAKLFAQDVEKAAADSMSRHNIAPADIQLNIHVDVQTVYRSDFPKEG